MDTENVRDEAKRLVDDLPEGRPFGIILLAAALLAAGLAGIAAFWVAWPRTSNTSPLAALFALVWSCTYMVAALLTWRGSRLAAPAFLAAMGLLLPLFAFIFPEGRVVLLPSFVVTFLLGLLGYRYLTMITRAVTRGTIHSGP